MFLPISKKKVGSVVAADSTGHQTNNELRRFFSRRSLMAAALAAGSLSSLPAWAQLRIEITGVGANRIPLALERFNGSAEPVSI